MAKKKEPSLADSLNNFKDTMLRASLSNYVYVNLSASIMISIMLRSLGDNVSYIEMIGHE